VKVTHEAKTVRVEVSGELGQDDSLACGARSHPLRISLTLKARAKEKN